MALRAAQCGYQGCIEDSSSDVDWQIARLLVVRKVIMARPQTARRDAIVQAIDDVIVRVEMSRLPDAPDQS